MTSDDTINAFLDAWKSSNWQAMYEVTQLTWCDVKKPDDLKDMFELKTPLKHAEIIDKVATGKCLMDYTIIITYTFLQEMTIERIKCRVICEEAPYKPRSTGTWGVNPISALRAV